MHKGPFHSVSSMDVKPFIRKTNNLSQFCTKTVGCRPNGQSKLPLPFQERIGVLVQSIWGLPRASQTAGALCPNQWGVAE